MSESEFIELKNFQDGTFGFNRLLGDSMKAIKAQLKREIDCLDEQYLELAYNILRQFPHLSNATNQHSANSIKKLALLDTLLTLEEIEDEFPNVDINLLPLDNITL